MASLACPACGNQMSTPMRGRRTGLWLSTCRNGRCGHTVRSATPFTAPPPDPAHSLMFMPVTTRPAPPAPKPGALARFDRAHTAGTLRRAILDNRKQVTQAAALDPKLRQLGREA